MRNTMLTLAAAATLAAVPAWAQTADSAAALAAAPATAPAVRHWGDSVTLQSNGLSLRFPADNVRWREVRDPNSRNGGTMLVGEVRGARPIQLRFWTHPQTGSCASFVVMQRGSFERMRRLGLRAPEERVLNNPDWLPPGGGWDSLVWMGNACRDGVREALIITVDEAYDLTDRRAEALRTLLWYLGEAATRKQM